MRITVEVTDSDIAKGMKNFDNGKKCPYALAINRAFKKFKIKAKGSINWGGTVIVRGNGAYCSVRPSALSRMPGGIGFAGDIFTAAHIKFIATKRKFVISLPSEIL